MAERVRARRLSDEEGRQLQQIARRGKHGSIRVRRALIIMASASGTAVAAIARLVQADEDTVRQVIHRFNEIGLACLDPRWAGGRPRRISPDEMAYIVAIALTRPEKLGLPFTRWSIRKLVDYLAANPVRVVEVPVREVLGSWGGVATEPSVVFEGGPVQPEAAICLARVRTGTAELKGFSRVQGTLGTVDLTSDPDLMRDQLLDVRVFAGYAGWAPGQLEEEIATGSWLTFSSLPSDAFTERPDDLWATVLRRQGGIQAAIAIYPTDPTLN